jgi:hypothetical protein
MCLVDLVNRYFIGSPTLSLLMLSVNITELGTTGDYLSGSIWQVGARIKVVSRLAADGQ